MEKSDGVRTKDRKNENKIAPVCNRTLSQLIIAITVSLIITKNSISTKKDSKKKSKK